MLEVFRLHLHRLFSGIRLKRKFPYSTFHAGVYIDKCSKIGKWVTLFRNVRVLRSRIGDHTFVQENSILNRTEVGKFCSIARDVTIGLGQHPTDYVSTHPAFYSNSQPIMKTFCNNNRYQPFGKTEVGHDVWIGQNALIKDGITIGSGAVISAGAVVIRDVPDYALVAGVPAKIRKIRFDIRTIEKLLDIQWWNKSENWLEAHARHFQNPVEFFNRFDDVGDED